MKIPGGKHFNAVVLGGLNKALSFYRFADGDFTSWQTIQLMEGICDVDWRNDLLLCACNEGRVIAYGTSGYDASKAIQKAPTSYKHKIDGVSESCSQKFLDAT